MPRIVFDMTDAMNDDWIRSARLKKKAEAGDEKAQRKLDREEKIKLVPIEDLEE